MKLSKIFICFFVTIYNIGYTQIVIEEEFNGGTLAPPGWIFNSIGSTLSSNSNYGKTAPSIVFDATNDQITSSTFIAGIANSVTFWAQSTGATPTTDNIVVECFDGVVWAACTGSPFSFNTTTRILEATFPITTIRVRIRYNKTVANLGLDDVTIVNKDATCTASSFLWFSSINYNSCNTSVCEGTDEFVSFQNGLSPFNIADLEINVPTVGTGPEGTTFCGNAVNPCDEFFTTNPAYVAVLNGVAGCAGFFLSPPGGIIPPNGKVIVFMGNPPSLTINFATLCSGGGNYYCVFVSNTTNCTGRYSNSSTALRYTTIRNRNTGCIVERGFTPSIGSGNDGDIVAFDPPGTPSYISNPGCTGFIVLPVNVKDFYAETLENKIVLKWTVAAEKNVVYYLLEKSFNGIVFSPLNTIYSNSNSESENNLEYLNYDFAPKNGINYYRLKHVENDGYVVTHKTIAVNYNSAANASIWIYQTTESIKIGYEKSPLSKSVLIFDLSGRIIKDIPLKTEAPAENEIFKSELSKGIYLISGSNPQDLFLQKLIID